MFIFLIKLKNIKCIILFSITENYINKMLLSLFLHWGPWLEGIKIF